MTAFRPRTGFVSGVLATLATYVLVTLPALFLSPSHGTLTGFDIYHALYYHAHNPLSAFSVGGDPFGLAGSPLWLVLLLVPPVVLISQAHELAAADSALPTAIQQGVSVVFGYAPVALAGLLVLGGNIVVVDVVWTVVIYPVGFGIVGGVVSYLDWFPSLPDEW